MTPPPPFETPSSVLRHVVTYGVSTRENARQAFGEKEGVG